MPRFLIVQTDPILKDVKRNMEDASRLVERELLLKSDTLESKVDAMLLPEMAFTGYCFASRAEIAPFLEDSANTESRPSITWAQQWGQSFLFTHF